MTKTVYILSDIFSKKLDFTATLFCFLFVSEFNRLASYYLNGNTFFHSIQNYSVFCSYSEVHRKTRMPSNWENCQSGRYCFSATVHSNLQQFCPLICRKKQKSVSNRIFIDQVNLPWLGDNESTLRFSSHVVTCLLYTIEDLRCSLLLITQRQAGKLWIPIFSLYLGLTGNQTRVFIVSVADALFTRQ